MSDKDEALRLADSAHLGYRVGWQRQAAACLRRQHAEIESAHQAQREAENELSRALARHAMAESALKAERDALRADAERYRWLRNMDHWPACFDSYRAPEPVRGPELDAAIDAAKEAGE